MSLPEIQMLWVSGPLSTLERLSIVSHLQNGHPVRLFSYEPIPNLPALRSQGVRVELPEFVEIAGLPEHGRRSRLPAFQYHERPGILDDAIPGGALAPLRRSILRLEEPTSEYALT